MLSYAPRLSFRGHFAIVASLALLTAIIGASVAQAYERPQFTNVSRDGNESVKPRVAQDPEGNVHVVWDSNEGGRKVMYAKGTWNGSNYTFGPKQQIADVGRWQYATPTVFVAPNSQVMVVWTEPAVKVKVFGVNESPPAGPGTTIGTGITPSVSADYNNRFHIAWNGDFQVQYCEFDNGTCAVRETFPESEGSLRPDLAVDDENNVHLVWEGGLRIKYRTRVAGGGGFSATEDIASGVFSQVAVDGRGGIHIVASREFDTIYCRKTLGGPCVDQRTFSFEADLEPTIGATRGGNLIVVFRDDSFDVLVINVFENGAWTSSSEVASSTTQPDVTSRPYTSRFSFVWSGDFDIQHGTVNVTPANCDSVVSGLPAPEAAAPAQAPPVAPAQLASQLPVRLYFPVFEIAPQNLAPAPGPC